MIEITHNLLNIDEIVYLLNKINELPLEPSRFTPDFTNFYHRYRIFLEKSIKSRMEFFLFQTYKKQYILKEDGVWINEITKLTNENDKFHFDGSVLTIVTYLNSEFEGGEFEYIDKNQQKIKINSQINLSIIMTNKVEHRVLPVTSGTRYSLVCFFELLDKKKLTLI